MNTSEIDRQYVTESIRRKKIHRNKKDLHSCFIATQERKLTYIFKAGLCDFNHWKGFFIFILLHLQVSSPWILSNIIH